MDEIIIPDNVTLEVVEGIDEGKIFAINNKTITLGRADVCDFQLTDDYVSNKHCQVVFRNDHFTAIDLGSMNKTMVNDKIYIQKNLLHHDVITLGKSKIRFNWEELDANTIDSSEDVFGDE